VTVAAAAIITAGSVAGGISAFAVIVVALIGLRAARIGAQHLGAQDEKLQEIHVLVNSRLTEALDRIESLETALHLATGIPQEMIRKEQTGTLTAPSPPVEVEGLEKPT
jgi:hypothetical protein